MWLNIMMATDGATLSRTGGHGIDGSRCCKGGGGTRPHLRSMGRDLCQSKTSMTRIGSYSFNSHIDIIVQRPWD